MACELLVVAGGKWFPDQGADAGPLHWQCSLSHWATREVPVRFVIFLKIHFIMLKNFHFFLIVENFVIKILGFCHMIFFFASLDVIIEFFFFSLLI